MSMMTLVRPFKPPHCAAFSSLAVLHEHHLSLAPTGSWQAKIIYSALLLVITLSLCSSPIDAQAASLLPAELPSALRTPQEKLIKQQRQHYLQARDALRRGHMVNYRKYRDRLYGYPLASHLDYYELSRRLRRLPHKQVDEFLEAQQGSYLANRLLKRWLFILAKRQRWNDYRTYYQEGLGSTQLTCHQLNARLNTGDPTALTEVEALWNVKYSQPDECTPVFNRWIAKGLLTEQVAWQRFIKALNAGNTHLARYLKKKLSTADQHYAALSLNLRNYPRHIRKRAKYAEQSEKMQQVISYGIGRYARKDALSALHEWHKFDAQQLFKDPLRQKTQQQLLNQLIRRRHHQAAEDWLKQLPQLTSEHLLEDLIREALRQQQWDSVFDTINRLNASVQQESRWLYWRARSQEALKRTDNTHPTPIQTYTQLALGRGYYSFLAADRLQHKYKLGDKAVTARPEDVLAIAQLPAARRARELLAVGELNPARREWLSIAKNLDHKGHLAAAKLAHQWGWHRKTIQSLAAVKDWDDLQMRFPLAYNQQVLKIAQQQRVSPPLLFAIARQESAFAADAKSPAGALGLMQLMPSTARYTARKAGVRYRKHDLLTPETNITLGSHYINELLTQFDGNRILASAAYNAGPSRVKKWLASSDQQLAHDIWVETIPFKETRKYVQNILAYSVIYGYRMGRSLPLLTDKELQQRL